MAVTLKRVAVGTGAGVALVLALAAVMTRRWEGMRYTPYRDVTGVLTVCDGKTHDVQDRRYSPVECEWFLRSELASADSVVRRCIPGPIPVPIEAALVDATYNLGPRVVCESTLLQRARKGDWRGVCDALLDWDHAGGRVIRGLQARREAERQLCMDGVPQ